MYSISSPCSFHPIFNNDLNIVTFNGSYNFNTLEELKNKLVNDFNWLDDNFASNKKSKHEYIMLIINELENQDANKEFIKFYERLAMNEGCCHVIISYTPHNNSEIVLSKNTYDKFEQSLNNFFSK
jgi:hypothetical protein